MKQTLIHSFLLPLAAGMALALAPAVQAEDSTDAFDRIWSLAKLYENADNPVLQELSFVGRAHVDFYHYDSNLGDNTDWNFRRLRLGLRARMFEDFIVRGEINADANNADPFYTHLTWAYIGYEPSRAFNLRAGKLYIPYTFDGNTSSTRLFTIDRSAIATNFWIPLAYVPSISVSGTTDTWTYQAAVISNGTPSREFGNFDASFALVGSLGYDFKEAVNSDRALLRLEYVYQDPTDKPIEMRPTEHLVSLNGEYRQGPYGIAADLTMSQDFGDRGDMLGFMLMPYYDIVPDRWQVVGRYTYVESDSPTGVRLGRYLSETGARGDELHELYAGVNRFIYGHRLKVQCGLTYTWLNRPLADDLDGFGATIGLRAFW